MSEPSAPMEHLAFEVRADIAQVLGFLRTYVYSARGAPDVTELLQAGDPHAWYLWLHLGCDIKPEDSDDGKGPLWDGEKLRIVLLRHLGGLTTVTFDFSSPAVVDFGSRLLVDMARRWPGIGSEFVYKRAVWRRRLGIGHISDEEVDPRRLLAAPPLETVDLALDWEDTGWSAPLVFEAEEQAQSLYQTFRQIFEDLRFGTFLRVESADCITGPWETWYLDPAEPMPARPDTPYGTWVPLLAWFDPDLSTGGAEPFTLAVRLQLTLGTSGALLLPRTVAAFGFRPMAIGRCMMWLSHRQVPEGDQGIWLVAYRIVYLMFLDSVWRRMVADLTGWAKEREARRESRAYAVPPDLKGTFTQAMRQAMQEIMGPQGERLGATPFADEGPSGHQGSDTPRVPGRAADRRKWEASWSLIRGQVRNGKSYETMSAWLARHHPEFAYSPRIVADIVRAGQAGLLEPADAH